MSGASRPVAHRVVLADKHRGGSSARELVLAVDRGAVVSALLESDVYVTHRRTTERVEVSVQTVAGHATVDISQTDGDAERANLRVASACTPERCDAVLNRVVPIVEAATTDQKDLTYESIL